jgi:hypothetical protein
MAIDATIGSQRSMRGTDSNSLLRVCDLAYHARDTSPSRLGRAKAERVIRHIVTELRRRNVPIPRGWS